MIFFGSMHVKAAKRRQICSTTKKGLCILECFHKAPPEKIGLQPFHMIHLIGLCESYLVSKFEVEKELIKAVAICFDCFACFEGFILKVKRPSALAGWAPLFSAFIYTFASSLVVHKLHKKNSGQAHFSRQFFGDGSCPL